MMFKALTFKDVLRQVRESNDCHKPAGSSDGGQFCSRDYGVETHTTVLGQQVGKTVAVRARSVDDAIRIATGAGYNATHAWEAPGGTFKKGTGPFERVSATGRRVARHAADAYRIRKPSADEQQMIDQAAEDWRTRRAYIDNAGNYRLRAGGAATPTHRTKGKIAPWNKIVKRRFKSSDLFHAYATSTK